MTSYPNPRFQPYGSSSPLSPTYTTMDIPTFRLQASRGMMRLTHCTNSGCVGVMVSVRPCDVRTRIMVLGAVRFHTLMARPLSIRPRAENVMTLRSIGAVTPSSITSTPAARPPSTISPILRVVPSLSETRASDVTHFATPGSPTSRMWMSPLMRVPSSSSLGTPLNSCSASDSFSVL